MMKNCIHPIPGFAVSHLTHVPIPEPLCALKEYVLSEHTCGNQPDVATTPLTSHQGETINAILRSLATSVFYILV
jgi:hypothetical protein